MATTLTINTKLYTMVGTTDERTSCECCGRTGLKGTVVLRPADGGDYVFFGSGCAAQAIGWTEPKIKTAAKNESIARNRAMRNEQTAATKELDAQLSDLSRPYYAAKRAGDQAEIDRIESLQAPLYAQKSVVYAAIADNYKI